MSDADKLKSLEERINRLETAVSGFQFGPVVDPAGPWGGGGGGHIPIHRPVGDPPPWDVSRFSVAQLKASLHAISAEKTRLEAMEGLINQQLKTK
jgi:hypothetical protein